MASSSDVAAVSSNGEHVDTMWSNLTESEMVTLNRSTQKRYVYKRMGSPVGRLTLVATDDGLAAILWEHDRPGHALADHPVRGDAILRAEWRSKSGRRLRFVRSAPPTEGIRSQSSRRVIGSLEPRASSPDSPAGSTLRPICWRLKAETL